MTDASPSRVALYVRVSSADQNAASQLARLREKIPSTPAPYEFVDDGVSGSLSSRPAFDTLRGLIRAGGVDVVAAAKLDRLGRSAKAVLEFFEEAEQHGVRVILTDQSIDTGTPSGKLVRTILAGVAEFEGDLIRERTRQAMDAFKKGTRTTSSGRPVGRPRRLTPEIVDRIRDLRLTGLKWREIAVRVHLPAGTVRKALPTAKARVENPLERIRTPPTAS